MNHIQVRAQRRLDAIETTSVRINRKIEESPKHPKAKAWKKRIAEYAISIEHLEIELKFGKRFLVGGTPTGDGVEVALPTGSLAVEGQ